MSQSKAVSSVNSSMPESAIPQPSWIPLISPIMSHQAMKKGYHIFPDIQCSIIYGPEPAVFNDGQMLATTHYHVDACLWRKDTFIDGATFLMPSKLPEAGVEKYAIELDNTTGIYHVSYRTTPKIGPKETYSAPAESDSSITELGPMIGQQAATEQSSPSTSSKSIIHMMPWNTLASTPMEAADANGANKSQSQNLMSVQKSPHMRNTCSAPRRSSSSTSTGDDSPASTALTSPTPSAFFEITSSAMIADLPKVPIITLGEPTAIIKALDLVKSRYLKDDFGKTTGDRCDDTTVFRRLSLDLKISRRQLTHLDKIQDGGFPSRKKFRISTENDLVLNENGQIVMRESI